MCGKNILLGISGGIAAYKAAILVRMLVKNQANVKVIMTPMAKKFITPLTMATVSRNPILVDFFTPENGNWNSHVDLGIWADAYLIAPATANTLAKMANGIADNLLLTTYLSSRCLIFAAPTMDLDMYKHVATQRNIDRLQADGVHMIQPESGELASGLIGKGRMAEPEQIFRQLSRFFEKKQKLRAKTFLVTAGPTYEEIDPVRYIGNHSSGKMGFAIAEELAAQGAFVKLICGPTHCKCQNANIERINVVSAKQMYEQAVRLFPKADGAVMSAAVADYTPQFVSENKIKHSEENISIKLTPTKDIAEELGKIKTAKQCLVGFALETNDEIANAQKKRKKKNLDFIVLNSLNDKGAGFGVDTNKITIIDSNNNFYNFELKPKTDLAKDIVEKIVEFSTNNALLK